MTPLRSLRSRRDTRLIAGRVVVITGGARGLGLATAKALALRGAHVAIGDLDGDLASSEAAELPGIGRSLGGSLDVTNATDFSNFLDKVEAELGPLDVLINNAGIMVVSPFIDEDPAMTRREMEINVFAVITGTQLALRRMLPRQSGHIVNIASAAGKAVVAGEATYCATKHAVVGLDESLRAEYRGSGVTISTVMPGLANTELAAGMKAGRGVPLVEPQEVADAIVSALETGRVDVFVPAKLGALMRLQALMPRSMSEAMSRAFQVDKIGTDVDRVARAAYAQRSARPVAMTGSDLRPVSVDTPGDPDPDSGA